VDVGWIVFGDDEDALASSRGQVLCGDGEAAAGRMNEGDIVRRDADELREQ
jgi:hypothetical protein